VDDPLTVRLVERVGDLDRVPQGLVGKKRTLGDAVGEGLALEVLHHQELFALFVTNVVERADVRMRQTRHRPGLALEPLSCRFVVGQDRWENLDGDRTVEPRVVCPVDLAHASGADGVEDLVWSESGPCAQAHLLRQGYRQWTGFPTETVV
jgi:hypothetical protein